MNLASDNVTGVAPEIMAALNRANETTAMMPYGADDITARLDALFGELFETEVAVYPVATGTAANALSMSVLCPPFGAIYCLEESHTNADECGAPEFYTNGAKLVSVPEHEGKMTAAALDARLANRGPADGVHVVQPAAVTITQASEMGTVYSAAEVAALGKTAKTWGLKLHVDGARFANAVAAGNASPADLTWRAGVDILSFGATKNGAMAAEAVVVFDPDAAETLGFRRKRGAHLFSKMRFLSAQLEAYVTDDLWLRNARHANNQAARLAGALQDVPSVDLLFPVDANEIFATAPKAVWDRLMAAGFVFYTWGNADRLHARFVTSFNTRPADVDTFIASLT
jgi:threonine aldolase